jgi:hypothetical protein
MGGSTLRARHKKKNGAPNLSLRRNNTVIFKPHFLEVPPNIRQSLHLHLGIPNSLLPSRFQGLQNTDMAPAVVQYMEWFGNLGVKNAATLD